MHHPVHFGPSSAALGDLAQAFVQQALQAVGFKSFNVAAKATLALAQQKGGLGLGQSTLAPAFIGFLESHLPVLLHVAAPAYGGVLHRTFHKPDRLLAKNRTGYLFPTDPSAEVEIFRLTC